jgi:hypothetical protein
MQRFRRAAAVLLVLATSGCGGPAITNAPATATPAPPTTEPTLAPTPTADPCADPAGAASMQIHGIEGLLSLELLEGDPGPAATVNPFIAEATDPVLGGAAEVELQVELGGGEAQGIELTQVVADFVPFEATAAEPVEATMAGAIATLQLPDRDVSGILRVAASWTTLCGPGSGGGKLGLKLLDPALAAGCPNTSDGLLEQVTDLQATTLRVGTLRVPIGIVGWSGRWIDASAIDDVPQFAGWDTSIAATVPAGENLPAKDTLGDGIDYLTLRFAFYRRADVEAYLAGTLDEISSVDVVRKNPSATGGVSVAMEVPPGQYVVEIQGTWQTPCLHVDSVTSVSVDRQ